ncbi:phage portal protein [Bifidobacterium sp. SO4]|nr:phage portal protein [Bifidobacterium sp. SO4]
MQYETPDDAQAALSAILLPSYGNTVGRLDRIDRWWRWNPKPIRLRRATPEHRMLRDMGVTPWLRLVVTTIAQTLYLEGVDMPGEPGTDATREFWHPWVANRMGRKQVALHKAAIAYGSAYAAVRDDPDSPGEARIECYSPREAIAVYRDPARDDWPQLFASIQHRCGAADCYELWDAYRIWRWERDENNMYRFIAATAHNATDAKGRPVCPVVRYTNDLDLEGRANGEVEPYIPLANRLNKDNYDRMLAQHYNSWKVRTATGLDMTDLTDEQRAKQKAKLSQEDILTGGEGVQFGTLTETTLSSLIEAKQADVEELAAVSQTPTTAFGKMVNVGDAGIAESRAGFYAKRDERQKSFGVSHMDVLRLAAGIEGRMDDAANFELTPIWEDTDVRTINQAVDALGKAAQMLGVPKEQLWDMIPGVSKSRADSWREYAEAHPDADALAVQAYQAQLNPVTDDGIDQ